MNLAGRVRKATRWLSPAGRIAVGLTIGGWLAGWRLGWIEGMWMAAAGAVVLIVALAFVFGSTDIEIVTVLDPQRVQVGEKSHGSLAVRNVGARRLLPLRVELRVGREVTPFDIRSLAVGASHEERLEFPNSRRQVIAVGPATSVRGDPLGLVRRTIDWGHVTNLYVHPKTARLEQLGSGFLRDLEGQATNDLSTNDVAFHTLREYVPGDDRRFIHWKTSARIGDLMVRQFVDTRRSHLVVLLDTRPTSYASEDEFELAVSLAASLGLRALRDEQDVTAMSGAGPIPTASGQQFLDSLAGVETKRRSEDLVRQAARVQRDGVAASIAALITGSAVALGTAQSAAMRFDSTVRAFVIRADLAGAAAIRPLGAATVLNISNLDEFGYVMWKVAQ